MRRAILVALLLAPAAARAQDLGEQFSIRLSLSGLYLTEQQSADAPENKQAAPFSLGYGELRAVIDARRLSNRVDLHLDGRVRATESWSIDDASSGNYPAITARGYLGGPEYELREAWAKVRDEHVDVLLGRQYVLEADALKIDGARLIWRVAEHWETGLFGGAYPDPYSRSVTTDYVGSFAAAGGAHVGYSYQKVWGSFGAASSYLGGMDDGGTLDPANPAGTPAREPPRTWVAWKSFERFTSWLDVYHDLVVDLTGAAGVQLTRLDAQAQLHASVFSVRLGYDYLSSLAIEMYLSRLLANRALFPNANIENNLTVQRTAHQQGRVEAQVALGKLRLFAEGRLRFRSIVQPKDDPQFVTASGTQVAPSLSWEATAGARDLGSLAGVRLALWGTYLTAFRGKSYIGALEAGRDFLGDKLAVDLRLLYSRTTDPLFGVACDGSTAMNALATCYGARVGNEYEAALTVAVSPAEHWFAFVDYRLLVDQSAGVPVILTHALLGRLEVRY